MAPEAGRNSCGDDEAFLWATAALGEARRTEKLRSAALLKAVVEELAFDLARELFLPLAPGRSAPFRATAPKRALLDNAMLRRRSTGARSREGGKMAQGHGRTIFYKTSRSASRAGGGAGADVGDGALALRATGRGTRVTLPATGEPADERTLEKPGAEGGRVVFGG